MVKEGADLKGKHPPKKLQGVLWSVSVEKLDLWEHKAYIVHQVLRYGKFEDIRWLLQAYGKDVVIEVFVTQPIKVYTAAVFNFIKNLVLGLKDTELPTKNYVSTVH